LYRYDGEMPLPDGVQQKLTHAQMHFEACKAQMTRYFDSKPCRMVRDADSPTNNPTFTFQVTKPVPAHLTLRMGDCLQNLRSALDYLVWELVLATKKQPSKDNMFPICVTPEGFKKALKGKRLEGIDSAAADLIGSFQPYHSGTQWDAEAMPLAALDNLVNINKHRRVLLTVIRSVPGNKLNWFKIGNTEWGVLSEKGSTQFAIKLAPGELQAHVDMAAFIAFNEGAAKGMEISMIMTTLIDYIANEVIAKFEQFF
jgi:hypothetical protein